MRKIMVLCLVLISILSGCGGSADVPETVVPAPGDFSFALPEGYSIAYTEDYSCSILRDADCIVVGGMEVTSLSRKALTEDGSDSVLYYLQVSFHQTNNVEYVTFHFNEGGPIKSVNMRVQWSEDGPQHMFTHYFFEWDTWVYHLWLDMDVLGDAEPNDFLSAVLS